MFDRSIIVAPMENCGQHSQVNGPARRALPLEYARAGRRTIGASLRARGLT